MDHGRLFNLILRAIHLIKAPELDYRPAAVLMSVAIPVHAKKQPQKENLVAFAKQS
jgi:hypothetical protein